MRFKTRYRFWQVLLILLALGILFTVIFPFITNKLGTDTVPVKEMPEPNLVSKNNGIWEIMGFLYYVVFFYFSLNYYYNLLGTNKKLISFIKVSAITLLVSFAYHCFLFYYFPQALAKRYESVGYVFFSILQDVFFIVVASLVFAYVTLLREAEKKRRVLEAQKILLEMQISQANFKFLKAQINPHFLHNTLNFLYAKSLPYSPELSEGILTLSDIMRYALSQENPKDGKTLLKEEVEHLHNVIKINQLRYSNQLKVNYEMSGGVEDETIIPFVLITIVENAFKHGDLKNQDYPIDIKLKVKGKKLYFYCMNKKKSGPKQISTGIGLENIKNRLNLAYGEKYKFIIKDESEFYTTELTIDEL